MILNAISPREGEFPAWVLPDGREVLASELLRDISVLRSRHINLLGKRVILRCQDPVAAARGLLTLDGLCREMLLAHPDATDDQLTLFRKEFDADALLTDASMSSDGASSPAPAPPAPNGSTTWIIPTSGTTGVPKLIRHDLASVTRSIKPGRDGLRPRWALMYGITRFAGLQVFLQSLFGGCTLIFPPQADTFNPILEFLAKQSCTAISATPTFWRKILMAPASNLLKLEQITMGGEIVDQGILDSVGKRFTAARVVHIYASTEVGVGFSVKDGRSGFPRSWLDSGVNGVEIKIFDNRLWLRVPGRNGIASPAVEHDADGFINTGDLVTVTGERVFFIGRCNGTINVGGQKAAPEEVEQVILSHPDVLMAAVYGAKNPFSGQVVVAEVVLADKTRRTPEFQRELLTYCRERLERYKVPAQVTFVDEIAVNNSGKLARRS